MIIPAILETSFEEAEKKIHNMENVSKAFEVDFIDNTSTEGFTFLDIEKIRGLKTKSEITIHFQVSNPSKYMQKRLIFLPMKTAKIPHVSTIIAQLTDIESTKKFLAFCKNLGYKVGISLDPDKEIESAKPLMKDVDIVQFMSVIPGRQGGEFIPSVPDKIIKFKKEFPGVVTHIDGGVNKGNLTQVIKTGVDNIVVGSAIFSTSDPKKTFLELSSIFEEERKTIGEPN